VSANLSVSDFLAASAKNRLVFIDLNAILSF
jgi:hypothetical protein